MSEEERKQIAQAADALFEKSAQLTALANKLLRLGGHISDN